MVLAAAERSVGWNASCVTPLKARAYLGSKVLSGLCHGNLSIGLLYGAGLSLGVRMAGDGWARMTAMVLIGLVPLRCSASSWGTCSANSMAGNRWAAALLALLGGAWGPVGASGGALHDVVS